MDKFMRITVIISSILTVIILVFLAVNQVRIFNHHNCVMQEMNIQIMQGNLIDLEQIRKECTCKV